MNCAREKGEKKENEGKSDNKKYISCYFDRTLEKILLSWPTYLSYIHTMICYAALHPEECVM